MARPCFSKNEKSIFLRNPNENENTTMNCKFILNHPPVFQSDSFFKGAKQFEKKADDKNLQLNNLNQGQGKLKFQCHYEERKRRAELRRRKIIQKLKKMYNIDVDGLNEDVTREIIMKMETLEKEKRKKEKANIERMVIMITRLIEEQKYKNRGTKIFHPPWRKTSKKFSKISCEEEKEAGEVEIKRGPRTKSICNFGKESVIPEEKVPSQTESFMKRKITVKSTGNEELPVAEQAEAAEEQVQKEETEKLPKCIEVHKNDFVKEEFSETEIEEPKVPQCISVERFLESTPKIVTFQDYQKDRVYLQDLKITNIGMETIHCRYLGIVVHTKGEKRFPVGVAVRDNVKLRPGLCCSTKIRLCSQDDSKELHCSVVYETRRKNEPLQHSLFFVQVVCLPLRALVKVTPLKITFPSLSWCEATGMEGARVLKKIIKIENSGGKACSCKINNRSLESKIFEVNVEEEELEIEEETMSLKTKSNTTEDNSQNMKFSKCNEYPGEDYIYPCRESVENTNLIIEELIENIFATFRFSPKFYIDIPPFSSTRVEVRFIPHYKGFHHEMHFIHFENCDNCVEQALELAGDVKKIPLRVEPQVIDLKICVANSGVYAQNFKIFNESKGPYAVYLKVPSSVRKHVHVHPRATTILPSNYSDFSVRIYPRVSLARDAPKYYNEDLQIFEFPVFIHPANVGDCKWDYLKIYVLALITDYCLQLSPPFIDFGTVTTLETVRTELELTNHSLAIQEYGFLGLPKGVRVEPNMGFGRILPKESITLYVLYSPGEDLLGYGKKEEDHEFQIAVTSIAKYGGFREKLEPELETPKSFEFFGGEGYEYELYNAKVCSYEGEYSPIIPPENSEDFGVCEEDSSVEDEEFCLKLYEEENKIREFLKRDHDKVSEHSFFKRMNVGAQDSLYPKESETENGGDKYSEFGEFEKVEKSAGICAKADIHIVNCRALIMQPRCQISESVIQLPATPCSSFSLYRFRLKANNEADEKNCSCGFQKLSKQNVGKSRFQGSFEFQYFCPHIKLEPESGFIKAGDSLPITVIYRPEFPAEQLRHQSRIKKAEKNALERMETSISQSEKGGKAKGKSHTPKTKPKEIIPENAIDDIINVSLFELENYDLFAGERSLQELITPFYVETYINCIIKTTEHGSQKEKTEIHEMVLICPAKKPNFIYLGSSQEIKFNKVFVGTMSKTLLKIQNISFERISPSITLLNPVGSFHCPGGMTKVEVDPEHVWRQPLVFRPLKDVGVEKQFFEIYCGSTNIFLTVSGEGIQPEYKITPNFTCCLIEIRPGVSEEIKLEIENLSTLKLNLSMQTKFLKEGPDLEKPEEESGLKKEKAPEKAESKEKKKPKNSPGERNYRFWEEIPEWISSALENFVDVEDKNLTPKMFTLAGFNDDNEILIPPFGRLQVKIQIVLTADKIGRTFAIKYGLLLEKMSTLKEVIVVAKILKVK